MRIRLGARTWNFWRIAPRSRIHPTKVGYQIGRKGRTVKGVTACILAGGSQNWRLPVWSRAKSYCRPQAPWVQQSGRCEIHGFRFIILPITLTPRLCWWKMKMSVLAGLRGFRRDFYQNAARQIPTRFAARRPSGRGHLLSAQLWFQNFTILLFGVLCPKQMCRTKSKRYGSIRIIQARGHPRPGGKTKCLRQRRYLCWSFGDESQFWILVSSKKPIIPGVKFGLAPRVWRPTPLRP